MEKRLLNAFRTTIEKQPSIGGRREREFIFSGFFWNRTPNLSGKAFAFIDLLIKGLPKTNLKWNA